MVLSLLSITQRASCLPDPEKESPFLLLSVTQSLVDLSVEFVCSACVAHLLDRRTWSASVVAILANSLSA
jgi:hypothetical protein